MISKRLRAIVDWIDGTCLADIGCDHAYVACQSVLEKKVDKAYACDIAKGPLENAKETIHKNHLENSVTCILSPGLENVPVDIDCVVIAGMGGKMIQSILEKATMIEGIQFLLSPHKDEEILRKYLHEKGFTIVREQRIEDDHYYPIIDCKYNHLQQDMNEFEMCYGKNIIKNEAYSHYLSFMIEKYTALIDKVPKDKKDYFQKQITDLKNALKKIELGKMNL